MLENREKLWWKNRKQWFMHKRELAQISSGLNFETDSLNYSTTSLQDNVEGKIYGRYIRYIVLHSSRNTKGVPYKLLRLKLLKANAKQLIHLETINPYLLKNTNELCSILSFLPEKSSRMMAAGKKYKWRDFYLAFLQLLLRFHL